MNTTLPPDFGTPARQSVTFRNAIIGGAAWQHRYARLAALIPLLILQLPFASFGQGTEFTYQGQLTDGGMPANGNYDVLFYLRDASVAGNPVGTTNRLAPVGVSNGRFTVTLDFTAAPFAAGADRWLQIEVRADGSVSAYTPLTPRQQITSTPYAITAANLTGTLPATRLTGTLPSSLLSGVYSGALAFANAGNSFTGNGAGLANVNAATLDGYDSCNLPCYWNLLGNAGTSPGVNFLGTTDNQPLTLKVNNITALQVQSAPTIPNIVGGLASAMPTIVAPNASGVVIAGGNAPSGVFSGNQPDDFMAAYDNDGTISGGFANKVGTDNLSVTDAAFATVGGGVQNVAEAFGATVGGGAGNRSSGARSVVAGGNVNYAIGDCSFIGGGSNNVIQAPTTASTVAGGWRNLIETNSIAATIAGGEQNTIGLDSEGATIGGGSYNRATGPVSVIAGGSYNNTSFDYAAVSGGISNNAAGYAASVGGGDANSSSGSWSVVVGGYTNQVTGDFSIVGGGSSNACYGNFSVIGGGAANICITDYGTIPGGFSNYVNGNYSFAAGQQAFVTNNGAFVWADSQNDPFRSTAEDQFSVRARGGLRLSTDTELVFGDTSSAKLSTDQGGAIELGDSASSGKTPFIDFHYGIGGSPLVDYSVRLWNNADEELSVWRASSSTPMAVFNAAGLTVNGTFVSTSDRNRKENFQPVNAGEVLAKVAALPLSRWNYKEDTGSTHIGPMAQDFFAAFGVGPDDKHIATVDADGVAFAAIQGLNQKLEEQRAENAELKSRLEALERIIGESTSR